MGVLTRPANLPTVPGRNQGTGGASDDEERSMTVLLEATFPRTLDVLLRRFGSGHAGSRIEAWLFEDEVARRGAETKLADAGVRARLRSAYKPLVHHFLEEAPKLAETIRVSLPTHPAASPGRFRLEAYPLAALVHRARLDFGPGGRELDHLVLVDGEEEPVFAPNRLRTDHLGNAVLTPCGWLRVWDAHGAKREDGPLETEYEAAFAAIMAAIAGHRWPTATPFFEVLDIAAGIPGIERPLPYGDEVLSTAEALHEDLYFSILELMKHGAGLAPADRTLQPGQIVPSIVAADGPARVTVSLRPGSAADWSLPGPASPEDADRPLTETQIASELEALGGTAMDIVSVQGRRLAARIYPGSGTPFLLSAGQHANETTGVAGALRAARQLRAAGQHFALIPCENPDGYALHHRLRAANPGHMHHAARYSALGDDVEARQAAPLHEKAARQTLIAETGAVLHLNLHGYPAHEWTRPLTGYLPRGFELWTIPKGFFLILRHLPGLEAQATPFLEALTAKLAEDPALARFNATQIAVWKAHAGEVPFPVLNGIPCTVGENGRQAVPFQLITEYPDETIYGGAFRLGATTQFRTVMEAVRLLNAGMLGGA
jgi:hypothetical protein